MKEGKAEEAWLLGWDEGDGMDRQERKERGKTGMKEMEWVDKGERLG